MRPVHYSADGRVPAAGHRRRPASGRAAPGPGAVAGGLVRNWRCAVLHHLERTQRLAGHTGFLALSMDSVRQDRSGGRLATAAQDPAVSHGDVRASTVDRLAGYLAAWWTAGPPSGRRACSLMAPPRPGADRGWLPRRTAPLCRRNPAIELGWPEATRGRSRTLAAHRRASAPHPGVRRRRAQSRWGGALSRAAGRLRPSPCRRGRRRHIPPAGGDGEVAAAPGPRWVCHPPSPPPPDRSSAGMMAQMFAEGRRDVLLRWPNTLKREASWWPTG